MRNETGFCFNILNCSFMNSSGQILIWLWQMQWSHLKELRFVVERSSWLVSYCIKTCTCKACTNKPHRPAYSLHLFFLNGECHLYASLASYSPHSSLIYPSLHANLEYLKSTWKKLPNLPSGEVRLTYSWVITSHKVGKSNLNTI